MSIFKDAKTMFLVTCSRADEQNGLELICDSITDIVITDEAAEESFSAAFAQIRKGIDDFILDEDILMNNRVLASLEEVGLSGLINEAHEDNLFTEIDLKTTPLFKFPIRYQLSREGVITLIQILVIQSL